MAQSDPCGPVYMTLPREVLYSDFKEKYFSETLRYDLPTHYPDPVKISEAAGLISKAENPLIITSSLGINIKGVDALTLLAEKYGIGIVSFNPEYMNFPAENPCHLGFNPDPHLDDSDLIIILDSDVPWYPGVKKPADSASIINIGIDPLYSGIPVRSFKSDVTVNSDSHLAIECLLKELEEKREINPKEIENRLNKLKEKHDTIFGDLYAKAEHASEAVPVNQGYISSRVNEIIDDNTVIVNEYNNQMIWQKNCKPGHYFGVSHAGYLGWATGAALGIKMASPEKTVITTVGDGSYMFSVPSACHYVSKAYRSSNTCDSI